MKHDNFDLQQLIKGKSLCIVESTANYRGEAEYIMPAVVGFETFEEAQKFALENSMSVVNLRKSDGWKYFYRHGTAEEAYDLYNEYSNRNDCIIYRMEDDITPEVKDDIKRSKTFEEIKKIIESANDIYEQIQELDEDHFLAVGNNELEILPNKAMEYSRDSYSYKIGVVDLSND